MKWNPVFPALLFGLLLSLPLSRAGELIQLRTSLYEIESGISDSPSQEELATLATDAHNKLSQLRFEFSTITPSGESVTTGKTKTIRYPSHYNTTRLIQAESDNQLYSIEPTGKTDHANSTIIPGQATSFAEKELGTTVKIKPTLRSDGSIQIDGSVNEVTLVDLSETNTSPLITSQKPKPESKAREVARDSRKGPTFSDASITFSTRIPKEDSPHYAVIKMKRSCFLNPLEAKEESGNPRAAGNTRTILTSTSSGATTYPARPDEEVAVLISVTAKTIKALPSAVPAKGNKIKIQVYFVESDDLIEASDPVMNPGKYEVLIRTLNQKKGVDFLTTPSVEALPGKQASVELTREFIYPVAYAPPEIAPDHAGKGSGFPVTPGTPTEFETVNTGIKMNLTATTRSNGDIAINTETILSEFDGFIDYGNPIIEVKNRAFGAPAPIHISENQILTPVFSYRKHENNVVIPNGSTCVLCDFTDTQETIIEDSGPLGLNKKTSKEMKRRQLFVILKAERVN